MIRTILAAFALTLLAASAHSTVNTEVFQPTMQVDSTDTVYFDLSNLGVQGNTALFPVYIASDDTIYSLDFSFRYDMDSIEYDSIIELTNYMQSFYYFNNNDSTLRYTSYSLQPYDINSALLNVQFDLTVQATLFDDDLYNLEGYLNGTKCAVKVLPTPTIGINETGETLTATIYPNPTASALYIYTKEDVAVTILSASGEVVAETKATGRIINSISTQSFVPGIYLVRITDGISSATQKLIKL